MGEPALRIEKLTKTYGKKAAVDELSLCIGHGVCFGFLGPNGAGKSTTLNILSGVLPPSSGNIYFSGRRVTGPGGDVRRMIGVLPENFLLFDHLTLAEHCLMLGPVYGLSPAESIRRGDELFDFLQLRDDHRRLAGEASYGMKKKLCLALALLHNPDICLLDEPFEGLDPLASENVQTLIRTLRRNGKTIFLCSHILSIVEDLVDEVGIVANGRLVFHDASLARRQEKIDLKAIFTRYAFPAAVMKADLSWLA